MAKTAPETSAQPYNRGAAITKHDATDIPEGVCDAIFCGGAGNIVVVPPEGSPYTLTGCLVGVIYPVRAKRVNSTSTTATNMVALYL